MPRVTDDRQYGQILTASIANYSETLQDLVFNSTPLWAILRENGLIRAYDGGPEIRVPLEIDKLDSQWFTGYDKIKIAPKELLNAAYFTPKRVVAPFSLTGTELLFNRGRAQRIDIMQLYLRNAEKSIIEAMEIAAFGDGTADGGRQMIGFAGAIPLVPNTGTYGGIDRSQHPIWNTTTYSVPDGDFPDIGTVWDSTTARPILSSIMRQHSRGRRYADLLIADNNSYQAIEDSMVAHQRIVDSARLGRLGFRALEVVTSVGPAAVVPAVGLGSVMPDNTIFGIDTEALAVYYHPDNNMVPFHEGDGAKPINQDAIAQGVVWTGEMVLSNPRFTWRLETAE